jgi:hypothetical protein
MDIHKLFIKHASIGQHFSTTDKKQMTFEDFQLAIQEYKESFPVDKSVKPATCKADLIYLYNAGYMRGHHDTVESQFTDIHHTDMDSYNEDIINEIIDERKLSV